MADQKFDGGMILRGLNIDLDRQVREQQGKISQLVTQNQVIIAMFRACIRKYGREGEMTITKDDIDANNPPTQKPALFLKNDGVNMHLALSPEGPKNVDGEKRIITLDNA